MGIWDRKSIQELAAPCEEGPHQLRRHLAPLHLIFIGIGCIIGAGLFSITGIAAANNAGPAIILSFMIAAIGCSFASLCYSELASMIPLSGSAYTYAYATMGEFIAWMIGWDLILMGFVGAIAAFTPLETVGYMTSIGTLFAFVVVCLGVLVLRYQMPHLPRPFKTPWVPVIPILGVIVCLLMMFSLGSATWMRLLI